MRLPSLSLLSLFVAGCGPRVEDTGQEGRAPDTTAPECTDDDGCDLGSICESETCVDGDRNNAVEEAEAVLWEEETQGVINPAEDVDWFAVEAEGGEFVRITVVTDELEDGLDSVVSVYTSGGKRLAWEDEHPAGNVSSADSMCFAYFPVAGTYYVKVEDAGTFYEDGTEVGGPDEVYTLTVSEWNSVGEEPDSAQEVGLDFGDTTANVLYSFPVLLGEEGDADWAALDLPEAGSPVSIVALQHGEESEVDPVVTMKNQDGDEVLSLGNPTPDAPAMLPAPLGTSYVLGVTDANGGGGSDYWTWVFFVVREAGSGNPEETEPNDDLVGAEVVDLEDQDPDSGKWWSGYRQGRLATADDADVFAFDVPFDGAYISANIGAQGYGSLLVARIEVLDAEGTVLATADSTAGEDVDVTNLGEYDTGSYFLRISSADGAAGGEGAYYLFGLHVTSFEFD